MKEKKLSGNDKILRWVDWAVDYLENCVYLGEEGQGLLNDGRDILTRYREKKKVRQ